MPIVINWIPTLTVTICLTLIFTWLGHKLLDRLSLLSVTAGMRLRAKKRYRAQDGDAGTQPKIDNSHLSALMQADTIASQVLPPETYINAINFQQTLLDAFHSCFDRCESFIDELMMKVCPEKWCVLPLWQQNKVYKHIKQNLRPFLDDVFDDILLEANTLFEFQQTLRAQIQHHRPPYTTTIFKCLSAQTEHLGQPLFKGAVLIAVSLGVILTMGLLIQDSTRQFTLIESLLISNLVAAAGLCLSNALAGWHNLGAPFKKAPQPAIDALHNLLSKQLLDIPSQLCALQHGSKRQCLEKILRIRIKQWFIDNAPNTNLFCLRTTFEEKRLLTQLAAAHCIRGMDVPFSETFADRLYQIQISQQLSSSLKSLSAQSLGLILKPTLNQYRKAWHSLLIVWIITPALFVI